VDMCLLAHGPWSGSVGQSAVVLGPWKVLGSTPLIFSGLGRWSLLGDGRATHEQSLRFACLCPSGEYPCRGRAVGPCLSAAQLTVSSSCTTPRRALSGHPNRVAVALRPGPPA
jgi:hypothetical protein